MNVDTVSLRAVPHKRTFHSAKTMKSCRQTMRSSDQSMNSPSKAEMQESNRRARADKAHTVFDYVRTAFGF